MPSFVGNMKIVSVDGSSVVHIGDSINVSPSSVSKTYAGSGSFNTGELVTTYNAVSGTITNDPDKVDTSQKEANVS